MGYSDSFLANILPAAQAYSADPAMSVDPGLSQQPLPPAGPPPPPGMSPEPQGPPLPPGMNAHPRGGPPAPDGISLQRFAMPMPSPAAIQAALQPPPSAAPAPAAPPAQTPTPSAPAPAPQRIIMKGGQSIPAQEVDTAGPKQKELYNKAFALEKDAQEDLTKGKTDAAWGEVARSQLVMEDAQRQQDAALERQRQQQAHLQAVQNEMQSTAENLSKQKLVAPSRNIGQIIAVALGAFATGFSGGKVPNMAWEIVQKDMDNDLKAQESAIQSKRGALDAKQRQFSNLVQQYGMDPAKDLWAAAQRDHMAAQIRQTAAMSSIPQIQSEGDARSKQMEAERDKFYAQAFITYKQASATAPQFVLPGNPIATSQGTAFSTMEKRGEQATEHGFKVDEQAAKAVSEKGKDSRSLTVTLPDGQQVLARDKEEATDMGKKIAAQQSLSKLVDRAKRLREELGVSGRAAGQDKLLTALSPTATAKKIAELKSLQGQMLVPLHPIFGQLSDSDKETAKEISGNLLSMSSGVDAQLDSFAQMPLLDIQARIKTLPDAVSAGSAQAPVQVNPLK